MRSPHGGRCRAAGALVSTAPPTQVPHPPRLTTVDSPGSLLVISRNTMSFALPESLREYIDARVRAGSYGNTSEYLRDLIRRDQHDQATQHLRDLIADGIASGEGRIATDDVIAALRERALAADA